MTVHLEDIGRQRRRRRFVPLGLLLGLSSFVVGVAIGDSTRTEIAVGETNSTTTSTAAPSTVPPTTSTIVEPTTTSSTTTTSTTEPPPALDETAPATAVIATLTELRLIDTRTGEPVGEPLDTIERLSSPSEAGATSFGRITLGADGYVYYAALRERHVGSTYRVKADGSGEPEFIAQGVSPARQAIGDLLATVGPPTNPALIITDVTGTIETQTIPGKSSDRHLHPSWAPEGRFLIIELLDSDDTSRLVYLRSGDDEYPNIDAAKPITRSEGIGWTSPYWRRRGEIVVIDQCCSMRGPGGSAQSGGPGVRRRVNPFQGNDTNVLAPVPFVVHHEYDANGDLSLFVDDDGILHWANDDVGADDAGADDADAAAAATDETPSIDEPAAPEPATNGTIPIDDVVVAADW